MFVSAYDSDVVLESGNGHELNYSCPYFTGLGLKPTSLGLAAV